MCINNNNNNKQEKQQQKHYLSKYHSTRNSHHSHPLSLFCVIHSRPCSLFHLCVCVVAKLQNRPRRHDGFKSLKKNLTFFEKRMEKEKMSCPCCYQLFDSSAECVRSMLQPCGHVLCHACSEVALDLRMCPYVA